MKKISETVFVCKSCGNEFNKWMGQCSSCGEWNSLKEMKNLNRSVGSKGSSRVKIGKEIKIINLGEKNPSTPLRIDNVFSTEISEFDRVLGKGIVRGSVVLFSGEPGIGKSTLLTQLIGKIGGLYVAGEESAQQIGLRVNRLGLDAKKFDILETNSIEEILELVERTNNVYKIAIVDSIQVMSSENATGVIGSVSQIKDSAFRLIELAKKTGMSIFIVGHVTKDGDIAGPKLLEHMVDTVLYFEGEKNGDLRILRSTKNRFGPTDEVGVFKMEEKGLREIKSEEINLIGVGEAKVGSVTTIVIEGTRPMAIEIQALVTESFSPMPKRNFVGVDFNRAQLLIAVAQKTLGIPLYKYDVFLSVTGGMKIEDTGMDLAVVAAMWSSYKERPLKNFKPTCSEISEHPPLKREVSKGRNKNGLVFIGEVSLLGEVKKVKNMEKREKEAKSLGRDVIHINSIRELKSL
jgi:DNA repair protein RadA/Sms